MTQKKDVLVLFSSSSSSAAHHDSSSEDESEEEREVSSEEYPWLLDLERRAEEEERKESYAKKEFNGVSSYVGEVDDQGRLSGRGTMYFTNGSFYQGEWAGSERNGSID